MGYATIFPPVLKPLADRGKARSGKGAKKGRGGKNQWKKTGKSGGKYDDGKEPLPDEDNEGRPYDLDRVIVNFANVGHTYGTRFVKKAEEGAVFHWEGVRRCIHHLTQEMNLVVIGVIFEKFKASDGDLQDMRTVIGVPEDIKQLCEYVEETPKITSLKGQKSADDEMTIKLAYRRNCLILDNDNYRDWLVNLKNEAIRAWFNYSQERIHMKYYFDSGLGCFELLEGNTIRSAVEQQRAEKRQLQTDAAPPREDGGSVELVASTDVSSSSSAALETGRRNRTRAVGQLGATTQLHVSSPSKRSIHPESAEAPQPVVEDVMPQTLVSGSSNASPLCSATLDGHVGRMRLLLKQKIDPNLPNQQGIHPLYYAVENEDLQAVQLLKSYGASVTQARGPHNEAVTAIVLRKLEEGAKLSERLLAELHIKSSGRQSLEVRSRPVENRMIRSREVEEVNVVPNASSNRDDVVLVEGEQVLRKRRRLTESTKVASALDRAKQLLQQQHRLRPRRRLASTPRAGADPYGGSECVDLESDEENNGMEDATSCAAKLAAALASVDAEYSDTEVAESNGERTTQSEHRALDIPTVVRGVVLRAEEDPYV